MNHGGGREGTRAFTPLGKVRYFFRGLVAKSLGLVCSGFTELQVSYISSESHSSRRY